MVYMSIVNNWKTVFFFFKQKTAYEMRISDWSSDVCSSDLHIVASAPVLFIGHERQKVAENKTLWKDNLVGERGFEPPAPASRRQCSTRLSYSPTAGIGCDPARQIGRAHV